MNALDFELKRFLSRIELTSNVEVLYDSDACKGTNWIQTFNRPAKGCRRSYLGRPDAAIVVDGKVRLFCESDQNLNPTHLLGKFYSKTKVASVEHKGYMYPVGVGAGLLQLVVIDAEDSNKWNQLKGLVQGILSDLERNPQWAIRSYRMFNANWTTPEKIGGEHEMLRYVQSVIVPLQIEPPRFKDWPIPIA